MLLELYVVLLCIPAEDRFGIPAEDRLGIPAEDRLGIPAEDRLGIPAEDRLGIPAEDRLGIPAEDRLMSQSMTTPRPLGIVYIDACFNIRFKSCEIYLFRKSHTISCYHIYQFFKLLVKFIFFSAQFVYFLHISLFLCTGHFQQCNVGILFTDCCL